MSEFHESYLVRTYVRTIIVILDAWEIWKHGNGCVFGGAGPCVQMLLQTVTDEGICAGAPVLHRLLPWSLLLDD